MEEPIVGDIRTITWEKGRDGNAVTWELGKLGVPGREFTEQPAIGETWKVQVVKDTSPGTRRGVLILSPLGQIDPDADAIAEDAPIDEFVIEDTLNVIQLAVATVGDAVVEVEREGRLVRFVVQPPSGQEGAVLGAGGDFIGALRVVMAYMLAYAGVRGWVDVEVGGRP